MHEKIRVMQISNSLGIGGLERVVVNLCLNLDREHFEISACALNRLGPFADELKRDGIPVHLNPHRTDRTDYFAFWRLKDIIRELRPHIVHTHNTNALFDGFLASILMGVPIKIHTEHARKFPDKLRYMAAECFISHFLDHIVAVSEETRNNLIHFEHIRPGKISVVKNGIIGSQYDIQIDTISKKRELGLDSFSYVIGLGVRLTPEKGITHLIKAAPSIIARFPGTAFVIAGRGFLMSTLQEEVKKIRLENNFIFLGPRLDIPEILQILDIYVLPSESEGLPLVILEAMAARRAIVATDVGGNSVAIQHGISGFLVPPRDPQALSERICELLADPAKRAAFAHGAQARFYAEFEVTHMVNEYVKIYLDCARRRGIIGA